MNATQLSRALYEVELAERKMKAAYKIAIDARVILRDGPLGRAFDEAYLEWIRARWDVGDKWVRAVWVKRP